MTPDVNVLVAASRADHPHHAPALAWLEGVLDDGGPRRNFIVLPMVAAGFLRLVTHPKVFAEPTPIEAAQAFLGALLAVPGVVMIELGPEWPLLGQLCAKHKLVGNDIPDAWIAAAVQTNHEHLGSFDKGFRRWLNTSELTLLKA